MLSTVDMVVQRRDGPRRLRDHNDDGDDDDGHIEADVRDGSFREEVSRGEGKCPGFARRDAAAMAKFVNTAAAAALSMELSVLMRHAEANTRLLQLLLLVVVVVTVVL